MKSIESLSLDLTVLIIAHRTSTLKKCYNKIGSNLIYRDAHHLTNYGLEILFKDFESFLNKQLQNL